MLFVHILKTNMVAMVSSGHSPSQHIMILSVPLWTQLTMGLFVYS